MKIKFTLISYACLIFSTPLYAGILPLEVTRSIENLCGKTFMNSHLKKTKEGVACLDKTIDILAAAYFSQYSRLYGIVIWYRVNELYPRLGNVEKYEKKLELEKVFIKSIRYYYLKNAVFPNFPVYDRKTDRFHIPEAELGYTTFDPFNEAVYLHNNL